jgi:hypothetical protein
MAKAAIDDGLSAAAARDADPECLGLRDQDVGKGAGPGVERQGGKGPVHG